jgi:ATP-dependent helicase/nuclease subunit A
MARERAARQREELNGLYVAMTRARECLVVSATDRRGESGSWATWWERLGPVLTPWALDPNVAQAQASGGSASGVQVWALPEIDLGKTASDAQLQLPGLAGRETKEAEQGLIDSSDAIETEASRLGQAVHLVLQWATQSGAHAERSAMVSSAALQHAVGPDRVAEHVERILGSTTCAPFFDVRRLEWAGNEVAVTVQGQVQRVDRLVAQKQPDGSLCWWVLDYKLNETPQTLPAYRAQLLAYAKAIAKLQPDDKVRCAFITGSGQLVEVH